MDEFIERQEQELRRRLDAQIAAEGGPSVAEVASAWAAFRERNAIIRDLCRLLGVKPKLLEAQGIAMNDYAALENFFKAPGWFTEPEKLAEAKQAGANYNAFLEDARKRFPAHP